MFAHDGSILATYKIFVSIKGVAENRCTQAPNVKYNFVNARIYVCYSVTVAADLLSPPYLVPVSQIILNKKHTRTFQ